MYRPKNTRAAYNSGERRYRKYFAKHEKGRKWKLFPASDNVLTRFVSTLADEGLAYGTIKGYLAGVRSAQLERGLEWVETSRRYKVKAALQGIRRVVGDRPRPKLAIKIKMLRRFATEVARRRETPSQRTKWGAVWAAVLTGFWGMLRKDNITPDKPGARNTLGMRKGLHRDDLTFTAARGDQPETAWLRIRYSKTVQFGERPHYVPLVATGDELCPVRALKAHLAEANPGPTDPLFLVPARRKGLFRALTHRELVEGIKTLARAAGVDPRQYSGHSLRRGGATYAFSLGAPKHLVQLQGNWRSDAVLLYHQLSLADRLVLPTLMARRLAGRGHQGG